MKEGTRVSAPTTPTFGKDSLELHNSFTDYMASSKNATSQKPMSRISENISVGKSRNPTTNSTLSNSLPKDPRLFKFPDVPTHQQTVSLTSPKSTSGSYNHSRPLSTTTRPRFQSSMSFDETRLATSRSAALHISSISKSTVGFSAHASVRPLPTESLTLFGARPNPLSHHLPGRRPASTTIPPRRLSSRRMSIL